MANLPSRSAKILLSCSATGVTALLIFIVAPTTNRIYAVTILMGLVASLWIWCFAPLRIGVYAGVAVSYCLYLQWQRIMDPLLVAVIFVFIACTELLYRILLHVREWGT